MSTPLSAPASAASARSIGQKLNLIVVSTTFLALVIAGAALVALDLRSQLRSIEKDLVTQAEMMGLVSSSALAFDDLKVATENLSVLRAKTNVVGAALFDDAGKLFATFKADSPGASLPDKTQPSSVSTGKTLVQVWRPVYAGQERVGTVYLVARHNLLGRALEYLGVLALVLNGSLLVALLLANRLQRSITEPVLALSAIARQILNRRDFSLRATKTSNDEIGTLVDLFNAMLIELGARAETLEEANRALRQSDERYQLAVRGSSAGLWDWDMLQDNIFYSPRFKALLGYDDLSFPNLPSSIENVMHPQDRQLVRDALRAHLRDNRPFHVEARLRLCSGEWRWFLMAGMVLKARSGVAFRMAGSMIDVTERKEAEQVLQEANRAKDEFLATLAHELRNPLAPIRTGLDILKRDEGNGAASRRARDTMERQLVHMIRLIDDLLDISRVNSGKIHLETSRITLADVVQTAVELSRPVIDARAHRLAVQLPPTAIHLMADSTRLAQALGNLLNNASKYTPENGSIALKAWQDGERAIIEVTDSGVGIAEDMLDDVFSLFTQVGRTLDRAQGGLGIGLYLVRSLVELHGGTVHASSAGAGLGSTFTVHLPCLPEALPIASEPANGASCEAGCIARKVLVVDDNVDAAETMAAVLQMMGHQTHTVHAGEAVLAAAQAMAPDVILLDIGLPGMSGYEVAQQLRATPQFNRTLLIAVTGWGSEGDRERSRNAGFDEHLTKPVDLEALDGLLARSATDRIA